MMAAYSLRRGSAGLRTLHGASVVERGRLARPRDLPSVQMA